MLQPWRTGTVIRIQNETLATRRFWIKVPELESFDFTPGQFVTLDLPIHEQRNKRWRSYSIASWPNGTNVFELVIVLLDGGLGTNYLFNEIKEGSEITLRGPQGVFVLPAAINKHLFFVCTGTGIAPFRSMAHHIINHNIPHQHIHLIFGSRTLPDALYMEEMKALQQKHDNFFYHPTFSRETAAEGVHIGYVHQVYEKICADNLHPPANFYLCGWKNMIDEARERIVKLGYDKKDIHFELYG
jgi:ferredoxin-NADP reductase